MMSYKLPKSEVYLYFIIWTSSVVYTFYRVYLDGKNIYLNELRDQDFEDGWTLFGKKDVSDEEWELWTSFLFRIIPWLVLHLCVSELIKLTSIEALPLCYLLITMGVLLTNFPVIVSAFFIFQLTLFFAAMTTSSKWVIWIVGIIFVILMNNGISSFLHSFILDHDKANLIFVSTGWFYIRCLDFVLAEYKEDTPLSIKFFNYLAFVFYLPSFFLGPFIPYNHFKFQMYAPSGSLIKERAIILLRSIFQYLFYYFVYELALHLFYCNAMHHDIMDYLPMGMWTISGIGVCMSNFFYLKYVVIYGIAISIATAENYKIPPHPKCIFTIHLYSRMWRHFDRGFYLFMFRRIYSPICGSRNASIKCRLFASLLCFLFVYMWHGGTLTMFYWSALNFLGLVCEAVCRHLWRSNINLKQYIVTHLGYTNLRRLEALVASPLWILAVISNFFFFGGHKMGLLFLKQIAQGSFLFYITLAIVSYSMCQVSIEVENFENRKYLK